MFILIV